MIRLFSTFFGLAFGFLLCWLSFTSYDTIIGALTFTDFYLWKVFIVALVTGFIGLRILRASGARTWATSEKINWKTEKLNRFHVIGSVLFGIGWGTCGTCPGPALAQLSSGKLAGGLTSIGIFAGIVLCDWGFPD